MSNETTRLSSEVLQKEPLLKALTELQASVTDSNLIIALPVSEAKVRTAGANLEKQVKALVMANE